MNVVDENGCTISALGGVEQSRLRTDDGWDCRVVRTIMDIACFAIRSRSLQRRRLLVEALMKLASL